MKGEIHLSQECVVAPVVEGIEYAHLDVGMPVEGQDLLITRDGVTVVDQDPHAHPAVGGVLESLGDEQAGVVAAKDEVLHVHGTLGGIDHLNSCDQPVDSGIDDVIARFVLMLLGRGEEFPAQAGVLRPFQGERGGLGRACAAGQRRAANHGKGDQHQQDPHVKSPPPTGHPP